jgi:hypothetical protein
MPSAQQFLGLAAGVTVGIIRGRFVGRLLMRYGPSPMNIGAAAALGLFGRSTCYRRGPETNRPTNAAPKAFVVHF